MSLQHPFAAPLRRRGRAARAGLAVALSAPVLLLAAGFAPTSPFRPMLFMDAEDTADGWGLMEPQASSVVPNAAYRNDGIGPDGQTVFADIAKEWGFDRALYGMGVAGFDATRDGILDYFVTSIGQTALLAGPAEDGFEEIAVAQGIAGGYTDLTYTATWSPVALDMDGDDLEDLYVRAGQIAAYSFISNGLDQRDFAWLIDSAGDGVEGEWVLLSDSEEAGRGAVAADMDDDGALELILGTDNGQLCFLDHDAFTFEVSSPPLTPTPGCG